MNDRWNRIVLERLNEARRAGNLAMVEFWKQMFDE